MAVIFRARREGGKLILTVEKQSFIRLVQSGQYEAFMDDIERRRAKNSAPGVNRQVGVHVRNTYKPSLEIVFQLVDTLPQVQLRVA